MQAAVVLPRVSGRGLPSTPHNCLVRIPAEVNRIHRDQDPHLGRELDHDCRLQKACAKPTSSPVLVPAR
jgi:hypothetical protein